MCNETVVENGCIMGICVHIMWLIINGTLCLVIVIGNLVTLYVLHSSLKFSPLISNHFIMSLAISDIVVGLTMPYHIIMHLYPHLAIDEFTCVLKFVLILFGCVASILNMTAIAADRYFAIVHPFKYERIMNSRVAYTVLCGGWGNALIFSTMPLYWNNWQLSQPCELGRVLPRFYTTLIITPAFLIIWTIMLFIYLRIWREAVHQVYRLRRLNLCNLRRSCFQVVLLVMGCFTLCWLPFLAAAFVQAAGYPSLVSPTLYEVVLTLAISSSAVNPIIYGWKNAEFKRMFSHIIRCRTASQSLQNERSSMEKPPSGNRNSQSYLDIQAQPNRNSDIYVDIQTTRESGPLQELQILSDL